MISNLGIVLLIGAQKGSCMQERLLTPTDFLVVCARS